MNNIEFSNISETVLLLNSIVSFNIYNRRTISFKVPTIEEEEIDSDFSIFLGICHLKPEEMQDKNLGFNFSNRGELILGLIVFADAYKEVLIKYLSKFILGMTIQKGYLYIDEVLVSSEEISYILDTILVAMAHKPLSDISLSKIEELKKEEERINSLSPLEKQHEETMERLRLAKERKANKQKSNSTLTLDKIIIGVMRTFEYKIEDIKKLNYFGLYHLFGYVYKIDNYETTRQLYTSGHLSEKAKFEHWLD